MFNLLDLKLFKQEIIIIIIESIAKNELSLEVYLNIAVFNKSHNRP